MSENDRKETDSKAVSSIRHRNDIEQLNRIESTLIFPRRIDVIISTWIRLLKLMISRRTFHLEFRCRIDGESTKMCPLGQNFDFLCLKTLSPG